MKFLYKLILLFLLFACDNSKIIQKKNELQQDANNINLYLIKTINQIDSLTVFTQNLYKNKNIKPKQKYKINASGVMYKPINEGGSAVFVTGYTPITNKVKNVVYLTEELDKEFIKIKKNSSYISQVYYNDENNINRIYPFFDVLTQYAPKMNILSFNFYYLADFKHNPSKKTVLIDTPYLDPAGRGWLLSIISPVYYKNYLKGVLGIDITINKITQGYINKNDCNRLIIDSKGNVITASEQAVKILSLPNLPSSRYYSTIKADTYQSEAYNILKSKDKKIRKLAKTLLIKRKNCIDCSLFYKKLKIIAVKIPKLNWLIIDLVEK